MLKSRLATAVAVVLAGLLSGCASSNSDTLNRTPLPLPTEAAQMSPTQSDAMADGIVTADEYEAGYQRYAACMSNAGYEVHEAERENDVITYFVTSDAVDSGADGECYNAEFLFVDQTWQVAHENTSESAQVLRECLIRLGFEPAETVPEMTEQFGQNGLSIEQCDIE